MIRFKLSVAQCAHAGDPGLGPVVVVAEADLEVRFTDGRGAEDCRLVGRNLWWFCGVVVGV